MPSSHVLACVLVALPNKRTICIPVKLIMGPKIINITAIINCGATGNFIDIGLFSQINLSLH